MLAKHIGIGVGVPRLRSKRHTLMLAKHIGIGDGLSPGGFSSLERILHETEIPCRINGNRRTIHDRHSRDTNQHYDVPIGGSLVHWIVDRFPGK